jgi:fatty aldehyde-generating acyl-ACP reductase
MYIETFIDPDKLGTQHIRGNINTVKKAALCARKERAAITALGGFTSIVLEGNFDSFSNNETAYTTGNTLTSAFIVKAVERAAGHHTINLPQSTILVLGATGDIGMACIRYFKHKVKKLLLCARNLSRLKEFSKTLYDENLEVSYGLSVDEMLPEADVIICVASASGFKLKGCKKNVLICDAGYPKNLDKAINNTSGVHLFHGGMGQVSMGFQFEPDYSQFFYQYPAPGIIHGCLLEAMVLALEKKFENYSSGKGNITVDKMEFIYQLSLKHGITVAPFYNANGLWQL